MRKLAAVVLFLAALGVGLAGESAQAQNGSATFLLTNSARYTIFLKFYSQNRTWVWPGPSDHYTLNDNAEHSFALASNIGEKICYGGGYSQDGSGTYWGVGFLGNEGCTGCCLICAAGNATHELEPGGLTTPNGAAARHADYRPLIRIECRRCRNGSG